MSAALPVAEPCCVEACTDIVVQNIPGPTGPAGGDGDDGADGVSPVTTLSVAYTMPGEGATSNATVASTAGLILGENVFVQNLGILKITGIVSANVVTLQNVENTASSLYTDNAAPGTIAPISSRVGPAGVQGPAGIITGTVAGSDIKGTYPLNIKLAIPNALGALAVGNGTDANSLSAGTNGQIPAYDSTQPLGIIPKSIIPITGGTNVAADRLVRLSSATGTPIALSASKASIKDPGGAGVVVADATAGDARGVDAVDLQVNRTSIGGTAVASGAQSFIGGGDDNKASAQRAVVTGGQKNSVTASEGFIGGGDSNLVDSTQGTIAGGDSNQISGGGANEAFIGGGNTNIITGAGQSVIAGGIFNAVSSQYGAVLGGITNSVSADAGVIAGGSTNIVSGQYGSVLGGGSNTVSGVTAAIIGGSEALADKYGQRAFAAGRFAAKGDAQQSDLVWRISTAIGAGATEMFLDGNSLRATIATGRTVAFDILITARGSGGLNAAWTVKGVINNLAGTTSIATAVVNALIADNSGATFGTLANVPIVAANDAADALVITVNNTAGATVVRWAAHGRLLEIGY